MRNLWDQLEARGVPTLRTHTHGRHRPHLSYVVLLSWDFDAVRTAVERLTDRGPFEVTFTALGASRAAAAAWSPRRAPS